MVRLPEKKKPTAIDQHMPSISQTAPVDMTNGESLKRAGGSGGGGGGRQPKRSKFEPDNGIDDAVKPGDIRWTVPRYLPPLPNEIDASEHQLLPEQPSIGPLYPASPIYSPPSPYRPVLRPAIPTPSELARPPNPSLASTSDLCAYLTRLEHAFDLVSADHALMQRELAEQLEIIRGQDEELAKDSIESRDLREQLERAYDREEELETRAEHAEAALAAMAG